MNSYKIKFYFLCGLLGRNKLAKLLKISYVTFMSYENDFDKMTLKQLELISELFDKHTQLNHI
jgi:hypothetical protein